MRTIPSRIVGFGLNATAGGFPKTIRIETTNGCNAKCIICPHSEMDRKIYNMNDELFHRIVSECADNKVDTLHLHNFGEPLLDKKIADRISLCKKLGIRRVKIFTNGALLNEEKGRALIEAGLDEIKISFDGANKEEFERIRAPLKYEDVVSNVIKLVEMRDELYKGKDKKRLKIEVTCSSTTDKDQTMSALAEHVDGFSFGKIHNWATWDSSAVSDAQPRSGSRKPCARVWRTFTILSNGQVALCCLDYDGKFVLGNLSDPSQTISKIWRNANYAHVRACHSQGRQEEIPLCANCAKSFW
jgi:hypothetical protein